MSLSVDNGHTGAKKQSWPDSLFFLTFVNIQLGFSPLYASIIIVRKANLPWKNTLMQKENANTQESLEALPLALHSADLGLLPCIIRTEAPAPAICTSGVSWKRGGCPTS